MNTTTYIYELSENGIPFYVGKTVTPNRRLYNHKSNLNNPNIEMTIIDSIDSTIAKDWIPLEKMWINSYLSWGFKLTNENDGGYGSPAGQKRAPRTEEFKQKLKQSMMGKNKGKTREFSEEWKEKIKQAKTGQKYPNRTHTVINHTEETKAKMKAAWERRKANNIIK